MIKKNNSFGKWVEWFGAVGQSGKDRESGSDENVFKINGDSVVSDVEVRLSSNGRGSLDGCCIWRFGSIKIMSGLV
jgi:hypothetical protein